MKRLLATLLLLSACAEDPSASYLGGIGDPVRGAALYAPRNFGDTARLAGRPAEAAVAAEQIEFLAAEFASHPRYASSANPAVLQALQQARAELRTTLSILPSAEPQPVILALRNAAVALRQGSRAQAEAALSLPAFTAGPAATLARLAALPHLPRAATAAGLVAAEVERHGTFRH